VHGINEYRRDHPWRKPNPGHDPDRRPRTWGWIPLTAILSDKMSDIEAGAAQGLGCGYSSDRAMPSGHVPSHEALADLPRRSHCSDRALRRLHPIAAPGIL
jgi:hypothetical protein